MMMKALRSFSNCRKIEGCYSFLFVFIFLLGINVYGWRSSGVNHVLIFELDPRNHLSEQHLMELAAIFGVIWTLSVLTFLYSSQLSIPSYANPLSLVVIMTLFMFNPTRTFRHDARFWLLRVSARIILAPFFYVGFADFWLADQLNSLSQALQDFQFLICFYVWRDTLDPTWDQAADLGRATPAVAVAGRLQRDEGRATFGTAGAAPRPEARPRPMLPDEVCA